MRVVASVVLPIGLLSTTSAQVSWPDCPCASEEQGCKSGTVDVSARCGCKVWTSYYDGEAFCYVADPSSCAEAQSSNLYPGAASVTCDSHAGHDHEEHAEHRAPPRERRRVLDAHRDERGEVALRRWRRDHRDGRCASFIRSGRRAVARVP